VSAELILVDLGELVQEFCDQLNSTQLKFI